MPRPLRPNVQAATGGEFDSVRDHILAAAHRVIARDGLAAASTRAIAEEAGIGAGTLYNYFENRLQLLGRAILHHAHGRARPLAELPSRAGEGTVRENVLAFAGEAVAILGDLIPSMAAAFADSELLAALQREFEIEDPEARGGEVLLNYLVAEQRIGRIAPDADCEAAVSIVMGICHDRAFQSYLKGEPPPPALPGREIEFILSALSPSES